MKVATLKSLAKRPDLVEGNFKIIIFYKGWDVTSPCPLTLLFCKSYKNTV